MKYFYAVAQIMFVVFAIVNLAIGNVMYYDFLILSLLISILRKLEEEDG